MFQNFVSLGQACSVASSMSKYGLRSWSGPFDWLVTSNFNWVLHYIENEFEDFLPREYLRRLDDNKSNDRQFRDEQSGFIFNHDCEYAFEEQYEELKQKYQRRIDKFLEATTSPTCFLRNIVSQNEIDYISSNQAYINRVIKKGNSQNEIVFIADYGLRFPAGFFYRGCRIPAMIHTGGGHFTYNELRSLFDGLDEFLEWCAQNYDSQSIIKGILFDRKKKFINSSKKAVLKCMKMMQEDIIF